MIQLTRLLRTAALPVFRYVNVGDISIRHHWTGDSIRLHSFQHKGYWWYGRNRERLTMEMFAKLVNKGDTVFEVGAHIGYVGNYLAWLAGPGGRVFCFEPSPLNLRYLRTNVARSSFNNITVIPAAAGDHTGEVPFFMENITGQNSSIVPQFQVLRINSSYNGLPSEYQECVVQMVTADSVGQMPNFVKIDAEGSELTVLSGMTEILRNGRPRIMVETEDRSPAVRLLETDGYVLSPRLDGNLFAVHRDDVGGVNIIAGIR